MSTPVWQPSAFYTPGNTVRRVSTAAAVSGVIGNAGFEDGDTGWDKQTGWTIVEDPARAFDGDWLARYQGPGAARILNETLSPCVAGQSITASCIVFQGASSKNNAGGRVELYWLDEMAVLISSSQGNLIVSSNGNKTSTVTAIAPAGTAFVQVVGYAFANGSDPVRIDTFTWNHTYVPVSDGFIFTAVQAAGGFSAGTEPTWPDVLGEQVIDNEVVWEAIDGSRVTWEANPILLSGPYEPTWPTVVGDSVADGSIVWTADARRVEDSRVPNSTSVAIGASKVFSGDVDIIPFCATVNALDWSTPDDAGYLPFGLQTYGANPVKALALYRGNLIAFNATGFQMWQIDEDPANMALLDAVPVGCVWPRSTAPVMNDLVFLSAVGVRNIGIAGASTNLQAGTFGEAVDPLVTPEIRDGTYTPFATFVPAYGQYWLFFGPQVFVMTITDKTKMSWSRYVFPEAITDVTQSGDQVYLRTATHKVWRLDESVGTVDDEFIVPPTNPGDDLVLTLSGGTFEGGSSAPTPVGSAVSSDVPQVTVASGNVTNVGQFAFYLDGFTFYSLIQAPDSVTKELLGAHYSIYVVEMDLEFLIADSDSTSWPFVYFGAAPSPPDPNGTYTFRFRIGPNGLPSLAFFCGTDSGRVGLDMDLLFGSPIFSSVPNVTVLYYDGNVTTPADFSVTTGGGTFRITNFTGLTSFYSIRNVANGDEYLLADATVNGTYLEWPVQTGFPSGDAVTLEFTTESSPGIDFQGIVQWPHLDFNTFGVEKMFVGFDLVADAPDGVSISVGYDQRDLTKRTAAYTMDADSLPGKLVPIPVSAPSFDLRLVFTGGGSTGWEWFASQVYVRDMRPGA